MKDYYKILEVKKGDNTRKIKLSYLKLISELNSKDNGYLNSTAKFQEIKEVYGVLSNYEQKEKYSEGTK